jgi:hypothetical protein
MSRDSNVDYAKWDKLKPDADFRQFNLSDFQLLYRSHLAGGIGWGMTVGGDVYFMRPFPDHRMYTAKSFKTVLTGSLDAFLVTSSEVSMEAHNRLWALNRFPDIPTWVVTYTTKDDPFTLQQKELKALDHSVATHWASSALPTSTIISVETRL